MTSAATMTKRRFARPWLVLAAALAWAAVGSLAAANDDLLRLQEDPNQWVMPLGNYSAWNYSPLDQINTENVSQLTVAWAFPTGVVDVHQAQPLVVGDTMFVVTPKPNTVYALDLNTPGRIKWSYRAEQPELENVIACCGAHTRGFSYAEGKLFVNTLDGQVLALDAETGALVWQAQNADLAIAESMSSPPLIVHDNVIVGLSGADYGIRGHITAYDINTGERKWRWYEMGPNEEMGIGDRWTPFYDDDKVANPGLDTWFGDSWKTGGGSMWGYWSYDPELNLFYYPTGNCAPHNPDYRRDPATAPGLETYTNKYCASVMARDADTGELVWAYSLTPQDQWDYDEVAAFTLIDIEVDGQLRHAMIHPSRNGFMYVLDRATGELVVEPWKFQADVNWAERIDLATGRPIYNPDTIVYTDQDTALRCPSGGGNVEGGAYSPLTGLYYVPAKHGCGITRGVAGTYEPGKSYTLVSRVPSPAGALGDGHRTWFQALDPATGDIVWDTKYFDVTNQHQILATGGGLLFQGHDMGNFVAMDATTGEELWSFPTGTGFGGSAMTFVGPDGKQYVAVIGSRTPVHQEVAADDPPDAAARYVRPGSILYVFSLP